MKVTTNQSKIWRIFLRKLSYPPMTYHRIQDKNWSHRVIFSYWTHHQPRDTSEEVCRTRRWNNNYAEDEVAQLGLNRGVRSVIANQPVTRSETEVHHDWWRVQGLVTISQFSLDRGPLKTKNQPSRITHKDVESNKHHMKSLIVTSG
jgi:hypothetical protein